MRSRAVVAVLATLLLVPASAFTFSRSLYFGDAGMAVANLQQFLNNDGDGNIAVTSYAPPCSTSRPRKASPQPAARGHSRGRASTQSRRSVQSG
jgi:hypothetical protein